MTIQPHEWGVDRVKTGVDRVKTGVDRVKTGVDRVKTGVDRVKTRVDRVKTRVDRVKTRVDSVWRLVPVGRERLLIEVRRASFGNGRWVSWQFHAREDFACRGRFGDDISLETRALATAITALGSAR